MPNDWQKGSCQRRPGDGVTGDSKAWPQQRARTKGAGRALGSAGGARAGARQLLHASTGATAAMNGPKSHLKGTLCPTASTWPCCGQLRNSSSSGSSKQTSRPASVGRGGTTPHCATRGSRQPAARSCQQQLPPPAKSHPYVRIVWTGTSGHTGVLSQLGQREGPRSPPVGACLRRAVSGSAVSLSTRLLPRAFRSARLCFTATLGTRAAVMVNLSPERLGTYPPRAPHGEAPPSWVPGSFPNADVSRRNRHH